VTTFLIQFDPQKIQGAKIILKVKDRQIKTIVLHPFKVFLSHSAKETSKKKPYTFVFLMKIEFDEGSI
jgi:hypothetical protein